MGSQPALELASLHQQLFTQPRETCLQPLTIQQWWKTIFKLNWITTGFLAHIRVPNARTYMSADLESFRNVTKPTNGALSWICPTLGITVSTTSFQSRFVVFHTSQWMMQFGPNTLLAKVDIKNAFRLIPVHPGDRHLLAMQWHNQVYVDGCLPFGLRSAPKLFNLMADLLSWITTQEGIHCILHYLDDFLIIAPPHSPLCQQGLDKFTQLCDMLGIPLASEKVEGPTSCLSFLGITLDTNRMEIRLPQDKLARIQEMLGRWLYKKKASKRKILSLVGLLQHATKVIRCGRTFTSRLYATAAKLKKQHFYTRLNRQFRSDVAWWHTFLRHWNGLSILRDPAVSSTPALVVQTDASGSWGCGAVFNHRWLQLKWPEEWIDEDIMAKELVPVVLMVAVWGPLLYRQHVLLQCDNLGLVTSINKGSAKPKLVMHLLRCLWFFTAYYDIALTASHILGAVNTAADQLSRDYTSQFFITCPRASRLPTPIPRPLVLVLSPTGPDWTSPKFRKLFKATIQST